ncbi:hypothetical protein ANDA3_1713 [plant metagenome]|uniref:Uncharacterized protein n=1 Tax=plant metagenome TaxID=1297885 RepID=A0A484SU11_9ZZZZ
MQTSPTQLGRRTNRWDGKAMKVMSVSDGGGRTLPGSPGGAR